MKEKPILMKSEMVRAILGGQKTQTRRIIKNLDSFLLEEGDYENFAQEDCHIEWSDIGHSGPGWYANSIDYPDEGYEFIECPYGIGDRLWVKETWQAVNLTRAEGGAIIDLQIEKKPTKVYNHLKFPKFSGDKRGLLWKATAPSWVPSNMLWKPSIFMPRWASRLSLEVIERRVERVREISPGDAYAEGVQLNAEKNHAYIKKFGKPVVFLHGFEKLWCLIHGPDAWQRNEWVWVIKFRVVT